jgi:hypothetical protein
VGKQTRRSMKKANQARDQLVGLIEGLVAKADVNDVLELLKSSLNKERIAGSVDEASSKIRANTGEVVERVRKASPKRARRGAAAVKGQAKRPPWVAALAGSLAAATAVVMLRRHQR